MYRLGNRVVRGKRGSKRMKSANLNVVITSIFGKHHLENLVLWLFMVLIHSSNQPMTHMTMSLCQLYRHNPQCQSKSKLNAARMKVFHVPFFRCLSPSDRAMLSPNGTRFSAILFETLHQLLVQFIPCEVLRFVNS